MTLEELEAERLVLKDKIDAAYWKFSRQARAKPPILVVPEAYERLRVVEDEIKRLRRGAR